MVFKDEQVCIISYPLLPTTAFKVKVPKLVPKHAALAPNICVPVVPILHPVVVPEGMLLLQPAQI
jgi:hypothetical protein